MSESQHQPLVLLVSKSANSTRLIAKHLRDYFVLLTADDAQSAWDNLLDNRAVAMIICELEQAIDQFGLLERIRDAHDNRLAATPMLLLVGESDSDASRESAFQKGATDFINLPFTSAELTARVRLHSNLYVQHSLEPTTEMPPVSAVNVLQQLSQDNFFNSRVLQELSFSQRHLLLLLQQWT